MSNIFQIENRRKCQYLHSANVLVNACHCIHLSKQPNCFLRMSLNHGLIDCSWKYVCTTFIEMSKLNVYAKTFETQKTLLDVLIPY